MSGSSKYTKYAPERPASHFKAGTSVSSPTLGRADDARLSRLFQKPDIIPNSNSEEDLKATILKSANELLLPIVQETYPDWFPGGKVYMDFNVTNPDPNMSAPDLPNVDTTQGDYAKPGGPTNIYTPNLKSPDPSGGGSIEPIVAPAIPVEEINPKVIPGGSPGTLSPAKESAAIFAGNKLPSRLVPGKAPNR